MYITMIMIRTDLRLRPDLGEETNMHIHQYADMASFAEIGIGGCLPATEEYREFIRKLHPSQILTGKLTVPFYEVEYSYITKRGNYRTAKKYIFLRLEHQDVDLEIEMLLMDRVEERNKQRPYRKISNVHILEIRPIAYATILFSK